MNAPHPVQFKGSSLARLLLGLAGWRVSFEGLPALQGVIVAYPHTSNWDFIVGILAKWAIGVPAHFWAKDTLFKAPANARRVGAAVSARSHWALACPWALRDSTGASARCGLWISSP